MSKPKIMVLLGSTRQNRMGEKILGWVKDQLVDNSEAEFEFVDLRDWKLDYYNEPTGASYIETYTDPKAKEWSEKVAQFDGYLLLTPEYNHGYPAVLKNALDLTYRSWNNKPVGFVSWGVAMGARAVEQLRLVAIELQMAPIREGVHIAAFSGGVDENGRPTDDHIKKFQRMVKQLLWWTHALIAARAQK